MLSSGKNNNEINKTELSIHKQEKNTPAQKTIEKQIDIKQNINLIQVIRHDDNKDSILVEHIKDELKFVFYDKGKNLLGHITVLQLLKFINSNYPTFLGNIDVASSVDIIKKYLCDVYDSGNDFQIKIVSHLESPFTGNIEMLVKLYNDLLRCETQIKLELAKFSQKDAKFIEYTIKQLHYVLLNHLLKIISSVSDAIKDDNSKKDVKDTLLKYSVGVVYKLTNLIRDEINQKSLEYKTIQEDVVRLSQVKLTMFEKLQSLYGMVETQNAKIDQILSGLTVIQAGGLLNLNNQSTTQTTTSTPISSKSSDSATSHSRHIESGTTASSTNNTTSTYIAGSSDTSTINSLKKQKRNLTSTTTSNSSSVKLYSSSSDKTDSESDSDYWKSDDTDNMTSISYLSKK